MIVVDGGNIVGNFFNSRNGISHGNPTSSSVQHLEVIVFVTKGNDVLFTDVVLFGDVVHSGFLVGSPVNQFEDVVLTTPDPWFHEVAVLLVDRLDNVLFVFRLIFNRQGDRVTVEVVGRQELVLSEAVW